MDRMPIEPGRAVRSTQGRDAGRHFVVVQVINEQFVLMADGLTRKLDHLKKKKIKHLKARPYRMDELWQLRENNTLQDASIRRFLKANGLGFEEPLSKEDE